MDYQEFYDALNDLGCTEEFKQKFNDACCQEKYKLLNDYRKELLDMIKECNKKIEIADYLLIKMKECCNK